MPINFDSLVAGDLRAIKDLEIRAFLIDIIKNGSFLKKKESLGNGEFKTKLSIGYTIYFKQSENTVTVVKVK